MSCDAEIRPDEQLAALRVLDANANRAAEGMRVVEEYCRFVLEDAHLSRLSRAARHGLAGALAQLQLAGRAVARDTLGDVGIPTANSPLDNLAATRDSLAQVAAANSERVKQALRAIEEYLKPQLPADAAQVESLRYQWYTLEKALLITRDCRARLAHARLYVLLGGGASECAFVEQAQTLIAAGVHVLQLRDKRLNDRELLSRARLLRRVIDDSTQGARPLLVINDRPDISVLARADGVHVGQDELAVRDARQIVGPDLLIGVSTHSIEQARQAVLDGASYLGCGPTFPSATKHFDQFPGLEFLQQVSAEISLPAFAIGGVTRDNLASVVSAGFRRVAVGHAIAGSQRPAEQVAALLASLPA